MVVTTYYKEVSNQYNNYRNVKMTFKPQVVIFFIDKYIQFRKFLFYFARYISTHASERIVSESMGN
jgi:hypothetical protein